MIRTNEAIDRAIAQLESLKSNGEYPLSKIVIEAIGLDKDLVLKRVIHLNRIPEDE